MPKSKGMNPATVIAESDQDAARVEEWARSQDTNALWSLIGYIENGVVKKAEPERFVYQFASVFFRPIVARILHERLGDNWREQLNSKTG